jgi:DNA helicase-4
VAKPGRYFFAVGDDWQTINRFAGADVSVMTGFQKWFGSGEVLKLEQTFRCPQALCDVSSAFISKNPAQITKKVRSVAQAAGPVLEAFQVDDRNKIGNAIDRYVMQLSEGVRAGTVSPGRNGKVSVYVLGRYNADRQHIPGDSYRYNREVDISFLTIHRSKGSEADYVILPEMLTEFRRRSFPSTRVDDPVLALAMPDSDDYPLGEERRLFYVALTRARRGVAMFTARGLRSTFLTELEADGAVVITDVDGAAIEEEHCPACKQGVMVPRTGPYGDFQSCSNFPYCRYKPRQRRQA